MNDIAANEVSADGAVDCRCPAGLVCPDCGRALGPSACGCASPRWIEFDGRTTVVMSAAVRHSPVDPVAARLAELAESGSWRDAVRQMNDPVVKATTSSIGPDLLYGLPLMSGSRALVIGADYGSLACLAGRCGWTVVSLEASKDAARFTLRRAAQDGIEVRTVVADQFDPPFAADSFDLIALDPGIFEARADGHADNRRLFEVLSKIVRTSGYLYVGVWNRHGLARLVTHCSVRLGRGSGRARTSSVREKLPSPHCTLVNLRKVLVASGFNTIEEFGLIGDARRQLAVYPLTKPEVRRVLHKIVTPNPSRRQRWADKLLSRPGLGRFLESDAAVVGRKLASPSLCLFPGLSPSGLVAQINSYTKVIATIFENGKLIAFGEAAKATGVDVRLAAAHSIITALAASSSQSDPAPPIAYAPPRGRRVFNSRTFYLYGAAEGRSLAAAVSGHEPLDTIERAVATVARHYPEFCRQLSNAALEASRSDAQLGSMLEQSDLHQQVDRLARQPTIAPIFPRIVAASQHARERGWRLDAVHGDLSFDNVFMSVDGAPILIDWDHLTLRSLPQIDLIRLYYDLAQHDRDGSLRARSLLPSVRKVILDNLGEQGFGGKDVNTLEWLFIAHQASMVLSKGGAIDGLIELFLTRRYGLAG